MKWRRNQCGYGRNPRRWSQPCDNRQGTIRWGSGRYIRQALDRSGDRRRRYGAGLRASCSQRRPLSIAASYSEVGRRWTFWCQKRLRPESEIGNRRSASAIPGRWSRREGTDPTPDDQRRTSWLVRNDGHTSSCPSRCSPHQQCPPVVWGPRIRRTHATSEPDRPGGATVRDTPE